MDTGYAFCLQRIYGILGVGEVLGMHTKTGCCLRGGCSCSICTGCTKNVFKEIYNVRRKSIEKNE